MRNHPVLCCGAGKSDAVAVEQVTSYGYGDDGGGDGGGCGGGDGYGYGGYGDDGGG